MKAELAKLSLQGAYAWYDEKRKNAHTALRMGMISAEVCKSLTDEAYENLKEYMAAYVRGLLKEARNDHH